MKTFLIIASLVLAIGTADARSRGDGPNHGGNDPTRGNEREHGGRDHGRGHDREAPAPSPSPSPSPAPEAAPTPHDGPDTRSPGGNTFCDRWPSDYYCRVK